MAIWRSLWHFLASQFTSGWWSYTSDYQNRLKSLSTLRSLKDGSRKETRIYLQQPTRENSDRVTESDDVWGFSDTSYRADADGIVEVTGSRYLLSGSKLPSLLRWASDTLQVNVPLQPALKHNPNALVIPEPQHTNGEFLQAVQTTLRDDQISRDALVRRRHGHGHTQEEMYDLKYANGLARIPDLVIYPETETQVAQIAQAANKHGVCLIPFGGGTNVSEALRCPSADRERMIVSVDTRRMDKVLWIDPVNRLAEIEAGAVGTNIMAVLAENGFTIGHEPDSCEFSTLGGWIATNASGMKKNRYGNIEDVVIEMRVVTPSGAILARSSGVSESGSSVNPRQSVGSDPMRYMFGSEGTLGIVVSATVKLWPLPPVQKYAAVMFPTWEQGVQFMYDLRQENGQPASVRLVDNEQFRMSQALKPARPTGLRGVLADVKSRMEHLYILGIKGFDPHRMVACTMVFEGSAAEVRSQELIVNRLVPKYGGVHAGAENGKRGYQMTYNIAYIRDFAMQHNIIAESFETSVAWSQVLELCQRVKERVGREHVKRGLPGKPLISCRVTQVYETGVAVYFYYAYYFEGVSEPAKVYAVVEEAAREEIMMCGGSLSHHHGVGKLRSKLLGHVWSDAALAWRQDIKKTLDPNDVFGSGNILL